MKMIKVDEQELEMYLFYHLSKRGYPIDTGGAKDVATLVLDYLEAIGVEVEE